MNAAKILILIVTLTLSACGMTGELYLPDKSADQQTQDPIKQSGKQPE